MSFKQLLLTLILLFILTCFAAEYDINAVMLENEQAFYITQQTTYTNSTGSELDYVLFSVYANCFRRETALPYDNATLEQAFPYGYAPAGIEFINIYVDGESASWSIQGETELFLRVDCELPDGASCVFGFEYTLLLSENAAFLGCGDYDWRLTQFYPAVCAYQNGAFITNPLSRAAKSFYSERSFFRMKLRLADGYALACGGTVITSGSDCYITLDDSRELAMCVSNRFHTKTSGKISVYGQNRFELKSVLKQAEKCVSAYEALFGSLPYDNLTIVLSESCTTIVSPGLIILSDTDDLERAIARQYLLDTDPCTDPFLTDGLAEYMSLLYIENSSGETAFKNYLNKEILPALSLTIPGSLTPDSYLSRFTTISDYDTVVIKRGAAVLHEIRTVLGKDAFIAALTAYIQCDFKDIQAFVETFSASSGIEIGNSLISWLYTIDEYVNQNMDYYE